MSEEEASVDAARPPTPSERELYDPDAPHTFEIQPMYCQWEACHRGFWELEDMVQHLHDYHVDIQAAKRPQCEWSDCPRKSKPQTSKFALLAHLRSHTGEKPFVCPRAECDKSFTRTDALQKHMRVQHNENMPLSRKPPTKKDKTEMEAAGISSLSSSTMSIFHAEMLDSSNAMYDPALLATGTPVLSAPIASGSGTPRLITPFASSVLAASADGREEQNKEEHDEPDDPEVSHAMDTNPSMHPDHVRYLCYLARHKYANEERLALQAELKELEIRRNAIMNEKETMLDSIFYAEIGPEATTVIRPISDIDIPPLKWQLANRTSLPNIGKRDVKVSKYEDDEE